MIELMLTNRRLDIYDCITLYSFFYLRFLVVLVNVAERNIELRV